MTDKITISRSQFQKWRIKAETISYDKWWNELVLESQKREPIERWGIVQDNGYIFLSFFNTRGEAEKAASVCNGRIVHLREVEGDV